MLWSWAIMGRIQKPMWTFKIGINRMSFEMWHQSSALGVCRFESISPQKWLAGWDSMCELLCSLARCREVCISGSSSAAMGDHEQTQLDCLCSRYGLATLDPNCSQLPSCLADRSELGKRSVASSALWPFPRKIFTSLDLALAFKSQYYCWFSYATFENNKSFNQIGQKRSLSGKEREICAAGANSWGANQQFIAKEKNMAACGKQWGLDLMRTVAEWAPRNEIRGETFE